MKIICHSDCVYSAEGRCTKPDDVVVMQWAGAEIKDTDMVICADYLKGEGDEKYNYPQQ